MGLVFWRYKALDEFNNIKSGEFDSNWTAMDICRFLAGAKKERVIYLELIELPIINIDAVPVPSDYAVTAVNLVKGNIANA